MSDPRIDIEQRLLARIADVFGTTPDEARRCVVALVALHDIGKFDLPAAVKALIKP